MIICGINGEHKVKRYEITLSGDLSGMHIDFFYEGDIIPIKENGAHNFVSISTKDNVLGFLEKIKDPNFYMTMDDLYKYTKDTKAIPTGGEDPEYTKYNNRV